MKKRERISFLIILTIALISGSCGKGYKEIGTIPIAGNDTVFYKIYFEKGLDHSKGVHYEIINNKGEIISRECLLFSTIDEIKEEEFYAGSFEDIIYITYFDSLVVYAVFNLRTREGCRCDYSYPQRYQADRNSMFQYLKENHNKNLKAHWEIF